MQKLYCRVRSVSLIIALILSAGMFSLTHATEAKGKKNIVPFEKIEKKIVWRESFAPSSDGNVFFAQTGQGPVIVLIPGGPGASSWNMRHWFEPLAQWFTLIAIDNMGRGRSDGLKNAEMHSVERDARDIEAVRAHLRLDRFSVYGHSYGGLVAMQYALDFGQHVERLMLGNTGHGAKSWQQAIDDSNHMVQQLYPEHWKKIEALRSTGVLSSDARYLEIYDQTEGDVYTHDLNHPPPPVPKSPFKADQGVNPVVYQAFLGDDPEWSVSGSLARVEFLPLLGKLRMPVLVISGRFDRVAQPRFAYAIRDALKNAPVALAIFEKSAHRPVREEPQAFQIRVRQFMDANK
jgi:proline iminopeptidase